MTVEQFNKAVDQILVPQNIKEGNRFTMTTVNPTITTSLHVLIPFETKWAKKEWALAEKLGLVLGCGQIFAYNVVDCGCEFDNRAKWPQAGEYLVISETTDGILPPLEASYVESLDFSGPILKVNRDSVSYVKGGNKGVVTRDKEDGRWYSGFGQSDNQAWVEWLIATGKINPPS